MKYPFYLHPGDVVSFDGRPCQVLSVNDCAAVIAIPQDPRTFKTVMGKTVTITRAHKRERICPDSPLTIIERANP